MDDIVKRLRMYGKAAMNPSVIADYSEEIAIHAADEIERLRKQVQHANDHADAAIEDMGLMREALERIANYPIPRPYFGKGGAIIPETLRDLARAALEESK